MNDTGDREGAGPQEADGRSEGAADQAGDAQQIVVASQVYPQPLFILPLT